MTLNCPVSVRDSLRSLTRLTSERGLLSALYPSLGESRHSWPGTWKDSRACELKTGQLLVFLTNHAKAVSLK